MNRCAREMIAVATLLLSAGLVPLGCGSSDDPIAEKCQEVCQVPEGHPCSTGEFEVRCVAKCRALSGDARDKGYKKEACGLCVAGLFKYSGKQCKGDELCTFGGAQETCEPAVGCSAEVEKCFDAQGPTSPAVPECVDVCVEEDVPPP